MLLRTMMCGAGETHRGGRATNEDSLIVESDLGLFAVLDGMGGAAAGEIAARLASEALVAFMRNHLANSNFTPRELLEFAVDWAGAAVYRAGKDHPEYRGMGTTVVACLVDSTRVVIGHVGDSRAYLLRDGHLQVLTRDHTVAQNLIDEGHLSTEAAARSEFKHVLTRNLGDEHGVQADILELALQAGDRVLLCSDGLSGCVASTAMHRILGSSDAPQEMARALIELALNGGEATDNITAVVLVNHEDAAMQSDEHVQTPIAMGAPA
jgi:PPM family protein phosphatase